ncbi:MAG: SDR family oxidoreductase [Burkholderiaceae bacterium]|jgi:NAD(P)-dependent dehydrogenase (short-subunit alcohol dehydrogenase family)|nr:SDR family oxidoreductase [Burkholderiaceae bacterium]
MGTVLVIGASRGIGLEFVRQYAADGARVIGTVRRDEDAVKLRELGAKPLLLDVLDEAAVGSFGEQLHGERLDVAIVNAGVYGPRTSAIAAPGGLDFDQVMHTNVRAPMQLIPQLLPGLAAAAGKLALVSSRMGSLSLMSSTSGWLYRASKAAANAALRAASLELGPHGIVCIAFHPGWVRTEMGGAGADIDAATSVAGMRRVLAAANASQNGKFLNFNGEQLSW